MDAHVLFIGVKPREFAPVSHFLRERGWRVEVADVAHWDESLEKWQQTLVIDAAGVTPAQLERALSLRAKRVIIGLLTPTDVDVRGIARSGLQDFVFKPISHIELYLRMKIAAERVQGDNEARNTKRATDTVSRPNAKPPTSIHVNEREKSVTVHGQLLQLSPKEYELLELLASDPGKVFTVREIIEHVWGYASRASAEDVHEYVHLLRKKIEELPSKPKIILTARGFGYRVRSSLDVKK